MRSDPRTTGVVLSEMADLGKSGQTMLVVTHAMAFARKVATRVYVLCDGVIVESGKPAEVLESPTHAATREPRAQRLSAFLRIFARLKMHHSATSDSDRAQPDHFLPARGRCRRARARK